MDKEKNRKNTIALVIILIIIIGAGLMLNKQLFRNKTIDINQITKSEIIEILKTNPDSLEYINQYEDFDIINKTVLTKESILEGQNATKFREVYQNISLEDGRYLKVELMNKQKDRGLITVLDMKNKRVAKAYWLILTKMQ